MKLKSLLFGTAAALVATTGARAADAIVYAEPEPMEYVRICDVYGAGFFYIPGTETCLQISGYVWYQISANSNWDYWAKSVRARVNFDARTDTAWGLLRSYIRVQGSWDPANQTVRSSVTDLLGLVSIPPGIVNSTANLGTDGAAFIDQAFLELGGLRMGYTESAWVASQSAGVAQYGSHSWSGLSYGYQQRALISYTFTGGNGFAATISLEDDGNANYMPDVVAAVMINQGWGGVWAKVGYDEDRSPPSLVPGLLPAPASFLGARAAGLSGSDGWGAQVGMQLNVPNSPGSSFRLIGYYANNANAYSVGSRWSVLASYGHQINPQLFASAGFQWFGDTNYGAAGNPNAWQGELNVVWTPVTQFEVRAEYNYFKASGVSGVHSGYLRFTRYF